MPSPGVTREALGLPEGPSWYHKQLIVNAPANALLAVFGRNDQGWRETSAFVRRLDEPRYRPIQTLGPDIDLYDFVGANESPVVYSTATKRSVQPKYEVKNSKLVVVEGEVSKAHYWEALIAIRLPGGKLERLPVPEDYVLHPKEYWVAEILGLAARGRLYIKIGKKRDMTPAEVQEHEEATGTKVSQGQRADYFIAEYDPISGSIVELTLLKTPFH